MTDEWVIQRIFTTARFLRPPRKMAVILFDVGDAPEIHTLDCDAAAADLVPVLRSLLARLESGALRMPVTQDGLRWVEDPPG